MRLSQPFWTVLFQHTNDRNSGTFKRGVTERGVFRYACPYIVSLRGWTGNRTATQMQHSLLVEGRPNCARQLLASTFLAPCVAATSYCEFCDPGHHANVDTPCLFTPFLNVPKKCLPPRIQHILHSSPRNSCCPNPFISRGKVGLPREKERLF